MIVERRFIRVHLKLIRGANFTKSPPGAEFFISLAGHLGGEGRDDLLANYLLLAIGSSLQFITT